MPGKLKVVIGLQVLNVILNIVNGSYIWGVIGLLIAVALFKGNNVVRIVVIVLAVLGLIGGVLGVLGLGAVLALMSAGGAGGMGQVVLAFAAVILALAGNIFTIWALTRQDVKEFMNSAAAAPPAA
ncbi:MAG: hypothetical protein AAGE52_08645 [Myxococcota bacterium]